jgi:hypothetical protein
VLFQRGADGQRGGQRHADVVDQDVERSDALLHLRDLRRIGDVLREGV